MKKKSSKIISDNRKARHYYEFLEFFEAGISLIGSEVKSLRAGQVSFMDSYVDFSGNEAWLLNLHIAPYENAGYVTQIPDRKRKLLLHRHEIKELIAKVEQKGLTVVPTKIYFKEGKVKLELALAKGRKTHDHREELKRRAETRDMERELTKY